MTADRHGSEIDNADRGQFPVVVIGASAGGLVALQAFFDHVPADSGMAFVVIVHLDPDRKSHMAELLQSRTPMTVRQVTRSMKVEPNRVYIIPPDKDLALTDGHFRLSDRSRPNRSRAPIDGFLRTLAETHSASAAGIILSGSGTDGTQGVGWIKERGGLTMAQTPEEADHPGMPQSAIATGQIDVVLSASMLGAEVVRILRDEPAVVASPTAAAEGDHELVGKALALVGETTAHDFSAYRRTTINRRILFNLLGNALRYTDEGSIAISSHSGEEGATIVVEDTGIGIAPEHLEQVFDRFWQVDQSKTRVRGGTGLGLMVSRSLARVMGGDITVTSELRRGSRFVVTLPRGG